MIRSFIASGRLVYVSAEDWELSQQHRWRCDRRGYVYRHQRCGGRKRRHIALHRLILPPPPGLHVDHIDGNPRNNTRENLRICTNAENARNSPKRTKGTSVYRGVGWHKAKRKWQASIRKDMRKIYLGAFSDEVEAARAYDRSARVLHGEFATLNFPDDAR